MRAHYHHHLAALAAASVLSMGCERGPSEPTTGAIAVTVATASADVDLDPDGYTLSVDGGPSTAVGVNGTVTIDAVPRGGHLVRIDGLAANCAVSGPNQVWVDLSGSTATAPAAFAVFCWTPNGGVGPWDY